MRKPVVVKWVIDVLAEELLGELSLSWELQSLKLKNVKRIMEDGCFNPTRTSALDKEHIEQMRVDMRRGRSFPRPVLVFDGEYYWLVSGFHRVTAAQAEGQDEIEFYVIRNDNETVRMRLMFELNIRHGKNIPHDERVTRAVYLVDHFNYSLKDAAKIMSVGLSTISNAICARETKLDLGKAGVGHTILKHLPAGHLTALHRIRNTNAQKAAAEFVVSRNLGTKETNSLVSDVKSQKTEEKMLAVVSEYDRRVAAPLPGLRTRKQRSPRIQLQLAAIRKTLESVENIAQLEITSAKEKKDVQNETRQIIGLMEKVILCKS